MNIVFTDLDNEIAELFNSYRDLFCVQIEFVPNKKRYFEIEIESYHSKRFGEKKSSEAFFDSDISLNEYHNLAWDLAEIALENEIPKNLYLWGKNTLAIINEKYKENLPPSDYFTRLNKVAIEEYIEGAANCWFYYWLKRELAELETLITKPMENPTSKPIENDLIDSPELDLVKSKMIVLIELGVIDKLKEHSFNNKQMSKCLAAITGGNPNTIRPLLSNLEGIKQNNTNPYNQPAIEQAITLLNELRCTNEVVKLQNKLSELINEKN